LLFVDGMFVKRYGLISLNTVYSNGVEITTYFLFICINFRQ